MDTYTPDGIFGSIRARPILPTVHLHHGHGHGHGHGHVTVADTVTVTVTVTYSIEGCAGEWF